MSVKCHLYREKNIDIFYMYLIIYGGAMDGHIYNLKYILYVDYDEIYLLCIMYGKMVKFLGVRGYLHIGRKIYLII